MPLDPRKVYGELGTHLRGVEARARNDKYNPAPVPALETEAVVEEPVLDLGVEIDALGDDDITALLGPPDPDPAVEPASPKLMSEQGSGVDSDTEPDGDEALDLDMLSDLEP